MLIAKEVLYCDKCGMPTEYCEYSPDYESHCLPWLKKNHLDIYRELVLLKKDEPDHSSPQDENETSAPVPSEPWTTEERLRAFYNKYMPEKLDNIPSLLEKYNGREEQLFTALVKKYGDEPEDPYITAKYGGDGEDEPEPEASTEDKKKRRGVSAKKKSSTESSEETRILIQKITRSRKKAVTIVNGMETVPNVKLKDVAKSFSKRFAGSSSVKDGANGKSKEIIIQGDHSEECAAWIIKNFSVDPQSVFLDMDGEFVPFG